MAYQFRIQAVNQADEPSEWSAWSVAATPAGKPFAPGTPRAVRDESAVDGGVVRVSWAAADDNGAALKDYTVTAHGGGSTEIRSVAPGTTTLNWRGLEKSTAYSFSVVATNAKGASPSSGRSGTVTPYGRPGAVTGLTTQATGSDRQLDISFSGAASNGSPVIYQYNLGGGWSSLGSATADTITVPANGSSYQLTVRATNAAGAGTSQTVATEVAYGPLRMPTIQASSQQGTVAFTWSPTNTATIGNGRSVTVTPTVNSSTVDNNGSYTSPRTRAATHYSMSIQVCVTGTSTCDTVTKSATSQRIPDPTASLQLGAAADATGLCAEPDAAENLYTNCHYSRLILDHFEPNSSHGIECVGTTAPGHPSGAGRSLVWNTATIRTDANGAFDGFPDACIITDRLTSAKVVIDGSLSTNTLTAPW